MEIINALRGLGLKQSKSYHGGDRSSAGSTSSSSASSSSRPLGPEETSLLSNGEINRLVEIKPPRPPGSVRSLKSESVGKRSRRSASLSSSRQSSPTPSTRSSVISVHLSPKFSKFSSRFRKNAKREARESSCEPADPETYKSTFVEFPSELDQQRRPLSCNGIELSPEHSELARRQTLLTRSLRESRRSSPAASVASSARSSVVLERRYLRNARASNRASLGSAVLGSCQFPVEEFRHDLFLDPNQGQSRKKNVVIQER